MRILIHTCCAACLIGPWEALTRAGHITTGFFYNPNVHPLIEFRRRLKAVKVLQERLPVPVIYDESYGLREFMQEVQWNIPGRCTDCYRLRLNRTAREAAARGYDAMTTTLLSSTHQEHDLIRHIGERAAELASVKFHYADWRGLAASSHERAREFRLYLQQYCGCVFSEEERFLHTNQHIYRGPGPKKSDEHLREP